MFMYLIEWRRIGMSKMSVMWKYFPLFSSESDKSFILTEFNQALIDRLFGMGLLVSIIHHYVTVFRD